MDNYTRISCEKIIETVGKLHARIRERFPGAGLENICAELHRLSKASAERQLWIRKPQIIIRLGIALIVILVLLGCLALASRLHYSEEIFSIPQFIQVLGSLSETVVFLGAVGVFLFTIEQKIKLRKALEALQELRELAHLIDLHQLTKDPQIYLFSKHDTPSSPERPLTLYELSRYFEYCIEMLALIGKLATLYIQNFQHPSAVDAVEDIEDLTTSLSTNIWQQTTILQGIAENTASRELRP